MSFELRSNYQPKGKELQDHERYPRLVLKGSVVFRCREPFSQCHLDYTSIDEAGIRWEQMPGHRGGNSSAGK